VFVGFEDTLSFVRFLFQANLLFLHDITIIPSEDYEADQGCYFPPTMIFDDFPAQPVFEKYGIWVGFALPGGGFVNLVSPNHEICKSAQESVPHSPDPRCHSDLPGWSL